MFQFFPGCKAGLYHPVNHQQKHSGTGKIMGEPLFTRQKKGIMPTQRAILLDLELTEIYDKIDLLLNNTRQSKQERVSIGFCQSIDFSSSIPEFSPYSEERIIFRPRSLNCNAVKIQMLSTESWTAPLTWDLFYLIQIYQIQILNSTPSPQQNRRFSSQSTAH